MITYTSGNLLDADVDAIVNTVNEVGVMGKGVALLIKDAYPQSSAEYVRKCAEGKVQVGEVLVTASYSLSRVKWIIHFPTKRHWRNKSRIEWIKVGLKSLHTAINDLGVTSIAVPPLGCGNGGLDWQDVKKLIDVELESLQGVDVIVYEPQKQLSIRKQQRHEQLTPARALILQALIDYSALGEHATMLEVQKLSWFLTRCIALFGFQDELRLKFSANRYGPYADQLRHLLERLDGSFIRSDKRIADSSPRDSVSIVDEGRNHVTEYFNSQMGMYHPLMKRLELLLFGFESPFGLELLSSIDYLQSLGHKLNTVDDVRKGLDKWPMNDSSVVDRKQKLFDDNSISVAVNRLIPFWDELGNSRLGQTSNPMNL